MLTMHALLQVSYGKEDFRLSDEEKEEEEVNTCVSALSELFQLPRQ